MNDELAAVLDQAEHADPVKGVELCRDAIASPGAEAIEAVAT